MKKIILIVGITIIAYLMICTGVTGFDYMKFLKTRTETDLDTEMVYQVYSEVEIQKDSSLEAVRLYRFPAMNGEKTKCVIYLPGGSYTSCNPYDVCIPAAAEAAEMGYSAFVLTYRVGDYVKDYMPVEDVAMGIKYLTDHAEELNVDMEGYMLTGFSAGGHLAGLFGSEKLGYGKHGVSKPGAIGLAYPLINASEGLFENWNIVSDFINHNLRGNCINIMIGDSSSKADSAALDIQSCVTEDYPKVFMVQGDADFLVRYKGNSELMADALKVNGVPYDYRLYSGLTHGFGIGTGTEAEGWNQDAIRFWQNDIRK